MIATACGVCDAHVELGPLTAHWSPPQGGIDLDVIVADHAKRIVWVIEEQRPDQRAAGQDVPPAACPLKRLSLRPQRLERVGGDRAPRQAAARAASSDQTEQLSSLGSNLGNLPRLLLTDALPDQRVA